MNTNQKQNHYYQETTSLVEVCKKSCQELVALMEQMKNRLLVEFGKKLKAHESVLRLALNEAEALAWETDYPHLVFATLAREKAQAAAKWEGRQQYVSQQSPLLSPAMVFAGAAA